jgi:hypothetical protein
MLAFAEMHLRARRLALVLGLAAFAAAMPAYADEVQFGPHDVVTVFFITKSDDKNRVDYGIRLDADCIPVSNSAVFGYWRDFEHTPPGRTSGFSLLDRIPYGISSQGIVTKTAAGADYFMRLKQFERTIAIATKKESDGTCSATPRAKINGNVAQLVSVYAKLAGPFSVEYIDIHGKEFATGNAITERAYK